LLRRGDARPRDQHERDYLAALRNYVRCKLLAKKDPRRAWITTTGYLNQADNFREKMTELEEEFITGAFATIKETK
jgi:hypothetical protein